MHSSVFAFHTSATACFYSLSLHDALPIWLSVLVVGRGADCFWQKCGGANRLASSDWRRAGDHFSGQRQSLLASRLAPRSEEHTSELQSRLHLVCRLLLEKKKKKK